MNSEKKSNVAQSWTEKYYLIEDPLYSASVKTAQFKRFAHLDDREQNNWEVFHWSARSKLEAAVYFYSQVQGWASPSPAWRWRYEPTAFLDWYLDAFFYELVSVFDVLLQEINVVYRCGLNTDEVRWLSTNGTRGIRELLKGEDDKLQELISSAYEHNVFVDLRKWRNITAHRHRIPKARLAMGRGDELLPKTTITTIKDPSTSEDFGISKLREYVNFIADLVTGAWRQLEVGVQNETCQSD